MDEKELKTSPKQRIIIGLIAFLMLGSIIAGYAVVILKGSNSSEATTSEISEEKILELEEAYEAKIAEFKEFSKSDFEKFVQFKSEITAYNETAANSGAVQTRDLLSGSGRELAEEDYNYLAYYVGWCADESVFDSTFDDASNPTGFVNILDASQGLIEGWNVGVVGMKLGGVREITIAGELAYGDSTEICGGYNKPLKFLVMPVANEGETAQYAAELEEAFYRLQYAYYGIDFDSISGE